jgi:hypothetical protein
MYVLAQPGAASGVRGKMSELVGWWVWWVRACVGVCLYMHTCVFVQTNTYMCIHTRIHAYALADILMYMHTHTHTERGIQRERECARASEERENCATLVSY